MESVSAGQRFGYWTVIERGPNYPLRPRQKGQGDRRWRCLCDCKREKLVAESSLLTGASNSCGCSKRINTIASIMGRLIIQENGCCTWPGADNGLGYGVVMFHGKQTYVHRLLYEHFVGPIPEGLVLDHIYCDNRPCANWAHLEPKTNSRNLSRNKNSLKTHCKNGHPLSGDNLRVQIGRKGYRFRTCRACQVANDAARWAKIGAAKKAAKASPVRPASG